MLEPLEGIGYISISVVGLGYVGLPTAVAMHDVGHHVNGIDINLEIIDTLSRGKNHLRDESLDIKIPMNSDRWQVSNKFENIADSDLVIITVPTPTKDDFTPDFSYVESAVYSVLSHINKGKKTKVVLESTVSPGSTRRIFNKIADRLEIAIDKDVFMAYSPERVSPGESGKSVKEVPRIVGCDQQDVGKYISNIYGQITSGGSRYVGKLEVSEAAKMIENVQRDINIAFINELATILPEMGIDIMSVLDAANSKWSFHRHEPGIGVGGHCIPVDPYYYIEASNKIGLPSKIAPIARGVNNSMPYIAAKDIMALTENISNPNLLVLGYSYKPEVGDTRKTPVLDLTKELYSNGININIWDPFVDPVEYPKFSNQVTDPYKVKNLDGVILATAHARCVNLNWEKILKNCDTNILYDGRRVLNKTVMEKQGWIYSGIGCPK